MSKESFKNQKQVYKTILEMNRNVLDSFDDRFIKHNKKDFNIINNKSTNSFEPKSIKSFIRFDT